MNVSYLCIACLEVVYVCTYVCSYWSISFILKGILLQSSKFNVRIDFFFNLLLAFSELITLAPEQGTYCQLCGGRAS